MISTEEFIIPRARQNALTPVYWNAVVQTSSAAKKQYGVMFPRIYFLFTPQDQCKQLFLKHEWKTLGEYIARRAINEKGYFENLETHKEHAKQHILSFLTEIRGKDISELPFPDLVNLTQRIYSLFIEHDAANVFLWFVAGDLLKQNIGARLGMQGDDLDSIALPEERTVATQMERNVIEAAVSENPLPNTAKALAEKYFWMPFGYDGPTVWDEKHFAHRIEEYQKHPKEAQAKLENVRKQDEEFAHTSKAILEKRKLENEEKRLIHILRSTAMWTDERKMLEFPLFFWYHQILGEFERRYSVPLISLKYLFTHELSELDERAQSLKEAAEQRRAHEFMVISTNGATRLATDAEVQEIKDVVERQSQEKDIHGNIACRGPESVYTARVKVLRSSSECPKVERGDILVAPMTTPDYVPAMERALGFITDEGGVTCHAAIVAREMNKPCMIGTKNATQILKDGDQIEMDVLRGIVIILK